MKIRALIICMALLVQLSACKDDVGTIVSDEDRDSLIRKYSPVEINYLFETAFFQDHVGAKTFLSKWKDHILVSIEGNLWENDSTYIIDALAQLNALKLPITLNLTGDTARSDLRIFVGDYKYLEKKLSLSNYVVFLGIGIIPDNLPEMTSAKVGIANTASTYKTLSSLDSANIRRSVILEEITQCLGLTGDSWFHHDSMFYEGKANTLRLHELDKQTLKLLYEPSIPGGYSRQQFETDFKDVLYHKYPKRKIFKYAKANNTPVRYLERILESSFTNPIYKYSGPTFVLLKGDVHPQDVAFCKGAIDKLNSVSDQFHLSLSPDDMWHQNPAITIQFNDSLLDKTIYAHRSMIPASMMITRRVAGKIKISYRKSHSSALQEPKNKLVFTSLYKMLGLDNITGEIADIDSLGNINFKPDYQEILALLYNPVFPNGFTKSEMEEVIAELKRPSD